METNQTLRYGIIGGLFLVPFIPFIISSSMLFPFITGKNFTFRILVLLIAAAWAILAVRDREYRPKKGMVLWSFAAFMAVLAVSTITAENPVKAFWSNFERMEGYLGLIHVFLYFIVLSSVVSAQKLWDKVWGTWLVSSLIMCVYASVQLSGKIVINQGGVRVDGTLGNATYLAVFMLVSLFISLFLFLRARNRSTAALILGPLALYQGIILYHTATRGAILGLIGGLFVTALLVAIGERERKSVRIAGAGILAGLVFLIAGFIAMRESMFVQQSPVLNRFASLTLTDIKSQGRFFIWPMAIEGFKERPILGWGLEGFNYVFNKYYDPGMYAQEQWFDRAHSAPLEWLIAGGILAFAAYVAIVGSALFVLWKDKNGVWSFAEKSVLTGLIAAYVFQSLFVFDNLVSYLLFFAVLAMIHGMGEDTRMHVPQVLELENVRHVFTSVVVVLALVGTYAWNIRPISASQELIGALQTASSAGSLAGEERDRELGRALDLFDGIFRKNLGLGTTEAREQMGASLNIFAAQGVSPQIQDRYASMMRREYEKQIAATPNDARPYLFFGGFLRATGDFAGAQEMLAKARELTPGKQTVLFEIGATYLTEGKFPQALQAFKTAFDSAPEYGEARLLYALAAVYAQDDALADELFASIPDSVIVDDQRVVSALAQNGRFEELERIFIRRVNSGEAVAQDYISLGAVYLQTGKRAEAVRALESYLARPDAEASVKSQFEFYITEIKAGRNP
jgi:O-antigen ligase/tetratricopeptide (TPR) repeat protein